MLSKLTAVGSEGLIRNSDALRGAMDLEVGSLATFFSGAHPSRGRVRASAASIGEAQGAREMSYEVQYPDAHLRITERETVEGRTMTVTALADSLIMDAVLRFVFPLEAVDSVALNGNVIPWQRQNKYHQVVGATAQVKYASGATVTFTPHLGSGGLPSGLELMTYLRDEPDAWILHIRVRATGPSHYSARGCSRWYNKPFPDAVQRILKRIPGFYKSTFLIRERVSQRIPFQTNGAVLLREGEHFEFRVSWETS